MNKVTTINLNGNAFQLEESGYELLKKYLDRAKTKLADDPDRDEILADFERAIAEKCDGYRHARKSIITESEVKKIIDDMGPVEPADEAGHEAEEETEPVDQPKRLYTLSEGAMIGGVANGLAAYFNIDVTIVRLAFVLLAFVSVGSGILAYIVLMLIIPEAVTPEQKAELRGQRFSAQDVLTRAKGKYSDVSSKEHWQRVAKENRPALANLGEALQRLVRVISLLIGIGFGVLLGLLTAAWIGGLWWLVFGHPHLTDQLSTISFWSIAAGMMAVYFIMALPLGVLTSTFLTIGAHRSWGSRSVRWLTAAVALWVVAIGVAISVAAVTGGRISDYQATHAQIDFDNHSLCINTNLCNGGQRRAYPLEKPPIPPLPPQVF